MKTAAIWMCLLWGYAASAQESPWIRRDSTLWGIRNGIVVGLYPGPLESLKEGANGGPRGLLRIGYDYQGVIYHINYIAVEPVVKGQIEFSEISPSSVDGRLGKVMWVSSSRLTPDSMIWVVDMEPFKNGARPYLRLSICRQRPDELGIAVFHHEGSAPMDRCAVTATMGNYSRLRRLYLQDTVIDARALYAGYQGIGFIEKEPYGASRFCRDSHGDPLVLAVTNETFAELASWPQQPAYLARWNWRYRPFYLLTQYWRKDKGQAGPGLVVRVNGRAKYWSGGSRDASRYVDIPGGPAFENFELREPYHPGQKAYFGLSLRTPRQLLRGVDRAQQP